MSDVRKFYVTKPELTEDMIQTISTVHDGAHLELYYNLIFSDMENFTLPDHLRPPVWALADRNIKNLLVIFSPGSGKSLLTEEVFPTYEIGFDQNTTILGVSAGADLPAAFLQASMNIIKESKVYKLLFPNIIPDDDAGWSKNMGMFVKRTVTGLSTPTYLALGYSSTLLTGKHARILIVDDLHNDENVSTGDARDKVETFFYQTLLNRVDPQGSRMIIVGRRWAADDLYGRLKKTGDWLVMTVPSIRETPELYYDVRIPPNLPCVFNDYHASDEVEDIKVVYGENEQEYGFYWKGMTGAYNSALLHKRNKPHIFETVFQSNPEAADTRIFNVDDFRDFSIPPELSIGRNYDTVADWMYSKHFDLIVQTWDTAWTAKAVNDASVGYVLGLKMCDKDHRSVDPEPLPVPYHYDVYVLDENYKHVEVGDLLDEVTTYFNLWQPQYVLIENSAAGIPIIQSLQTYSIQVIPVNTQHTTKVSRAIDGAKAGSMQGWARQWRIYIPRAAPWSNGLLNELSDFTGAKKKHDDRVDALIQGVNFAIDYGIQSKDLPPGWRSDAEIDEKINSQIINNHPLAQLPFLYENLQNPLYGLCGTCKNWIDGFCRVHKMKTPKLGSCQFYDPTSEATEVFEVFKKAPA